MSEAAEEASQLLAEHGSRALQLLVDRITSALRSGDEAEVARVDSVLRAAESQLHAAPPE